MKTPTRGRTIAAALIGGLALLAGLQASSFLSPAPLFVVSVVWLALLVAMIVLAVRVAAIWVGRVAAVSIALLLLAGGFLVTGIDWSGERGTWLPCRRNWAWLPSYLLRSSPEGEVRFEAGGVPVKVCYGRPAARGRKMIGGPNVPFGQLWRLGANEPTVIRPAAPIRIAGVPIADGNASLYAIPGPETWEIILNRSTSQWGIESEYTAEVEAQEIGRAIVASHRSPTFTERFTISADEAPNGAALVLRWENVEIRLRVEPIAR